MNTRTGLIALALPSALLLVACQSLQKDSNALRIVPTEQVRHGAARPEALYAIGRYHQGQIRYDQAIIAYQRVLADYPGHAETHNALGLIYAAQGRHAEATGEFAKAVDSAPAVASLRNNLGYAYLLQERFADAITALEIAAQLDPANHRVRDNLAIARDRLARGSSAPADTAAVRSAALTEHTAPPPARTQVVAVAANVYTLEVPARHSAPPATATGAPMAPKARLEVANGNGITGLATQAAAHLASAGHAAIRRTNQPPYRLPATEIQYRPGYEMQAGALQTTLRSGIPLVASHTLRADVQVRLVLGRDIRSVAELASN